MHYLFLAAWSGFYIDKSELLRAIGWPLGLLVGGWLGIRWWSSHIARQFEREPMSESKPGVDWNLSGLAKVLLLLFVAACWGLLLLL